MSACFVLTTKKSAHMVVDAAVYLASDFTLTSVNTTKATALVTLPAIISCTGANIVQRLIAEEIEEKWASFDELIRDGSEWLAEKFTDIAYERLDGDAQSQIFLIGWHKQKCAPGAYAIDLWTDGPEHEKWLANSALIPGFDPGALAMEFKDISANITGSPMPDVSRLGEKCFKVRAPDDYEPAVDLLHIIEAARHEPVAGIYAVGGKAVLSSIEEHGIRQRVIHEWREDRIGENITPMPIDWKAWRAAREATLASSLIPAGLSRLQRERMEKKARKGTLRAV
jgi:hypothetical protein